jgi:antitoxin MazE
MKTKVAKWGNSLGVRVPRAIAEGAGLKVGQIVDLQVKSGGVDLRIVTPVPRYSLAEMIAEIDRLGPENRPPFEDWGILPSEWPEEDWSDIAPSDEEMRMPDAGSRRSSSRRG